MVWTHTDSTEHSVVYLKNLETGKIGKVKTSTEEQWSPDISGTRIVWEQRIQRVKALFIRGIWQLETGVK